MDLLRARPRPSFGWFEAVILAVYAALVGCITFFHEPWTDEAQAWLIARDCSLHDIFFTRLHYEGSPGLWHFFLWILCRLHVSYTGMHWLTALLGVGAVYLLLRYSPFPPLVRAVLPFGFSLVFLTAIIARSYSLVPLLTFAACAVLSSKRNRPVLFAVLVGLLANTSLIAVLLALSLVPLYFFWPGRKPALVPRRPLLVAGSALALLLIFAVYTALPAPDMTYGRAAEFASHPADGRVLSDLTGIPRSVRKVNVSRAIPVRNIPDLKGAFLARHSSHRFVAHMVLRAVGVASFAFFSVSRSNILACAFYAALVWWLVRRRATVALLPLAFVVIGGHFLGAGEHHVNIVTAATVVALWFGWSRSESTSRSIELIFQVLLLAVFVEQIGWTAHAAAYDIRYPFDPSVELAHFIIPRAVDGSVANIAFEPLAVLPYTSRNIFFNQHTSYWTWKRGTDPDSYIVQTVEQHPRYILDAENSFADTIEPDQIMEQVPHGMSYELHDNRAYLQAHGYRQTHRFCSLEPAQFGFYKQTCDVVYEPSSGK